MQKRNQIGQFIFNEEKLVSRRILCPKPECFKIDCISHKYIKRQRDFSLNLNTTSSFRVQTIKVLITNLKKINLIKEMSKNFVILSLILIENNLKLVQSESESESKELPPEKSKPSYVLLLLMLLILAFIVVTIICCLKALFKLLFKKDDNLDDEGRK